MNAHLMKNSRLAILLLLMPLRAFSAENDGKTQAWADIIYDKGRMPIALTSMIGESIGVAPFESHEKNLEAIRQREFGDISADSLAAFAGDQLLRVEVAARAFEIFSEIGHFLISVIVRAEQAGLKGFVHDPTLFGGCLRAMFENLISLRKTPHEISEGAELRWAAIKPRVPKDLALLLDTLLLTNKHMGFEDAPYFPEVVDLVSKIH